MTYAFSINREQCTDCRRCMIACSLKKTGRVRMRDSRITITPSWPNPTEIGVCRFDDCAGHPCVDICPTGAISESGGLVVIDRETCTGCGACGNVCPYSAITLYDDAAWKCDFCGGDPACVKECATQAITVKVFGGKGD